MTATPDEAQPDGPTVHLETSYPTGLETADLRAALYRTAEQPLEGALPHDLAERIEQRRQNHDAT